MGGVVFAKNVYGGEDGRSSESATGFTGGGFVARQLSPWAAIQVEVLAAERGGRELFRFGDELKLSRTLTFRSSDGSTSETAGVSAGTS